LLPRYMEICLEPCFRTGLALSVVKELEVTPASCLSGLSSFLSCHHGHQHLPAHSMQMAPAL
jgi:hypothetical protein